MCNWTGRLTDNTDICYSEDCGGFYLQQYKGDFRSISRCVYPTGREAMDAFNNNSVSWEAWK